LAISPLETDPDHTIIRGCVRGIISSYGLARRSSSEEYEPLVGSSGRWPLGFLSLYRPDPGKGSEIWRVRCRSSLFLCLRRRHTQKRMIREKRPAAPMPAPRPALTATDIPPSGFWPSSEGVAPAAVASSSWAGSSPLLFFPAPGVAEGSAERVLLDEEACAPGLAVCPVGRSERLPAFATSVGLVWGALLVVAPVAVS
jgi:hypothetical protein